MRNYRYFWPREELPEARGQQLWLDAVLDQVRFKVSKRES